MNFVLQTPSLQHLPGVKIVAHLWSLSDVFAQIAQTCNGICVFYLKDSEEWKAIEEKVQSKVWALPLPQKCKQQLLHLIRPLGRELIDWCNNNCVDTDDVLLIDTFIPQQLRWSMHGTIDHQKTMKLMVKDERLSIERRYEIACIHCLEEEAGELFERMGEERRREYVTSEREMRRIDHQLKVNFFTCTLAGRATCEYWFEKLSQREKRIVLEDREIQKVSFRKSRASSLLYYLSLMSEEQQARMLRGYNREMLNCLLRWPMQSLFVEAAECGWWLMNSFIYSDVVLEIADQITCGFQNCLQLFWEFWRLGSAEYKRHVLNHVYRLECLFATNEEKIIKLVSNEAPSHILKEYLKQ